MSLNKKQRDLVSKLKAGWLIKVVLFDNKSKSFTITPNGYPEEISYLTFASLRSKFYLKQLPSDRLDTRLYAYCQRGEVEQIKEKELKKFGINQMPFVPFYGKTYASA